MDEKDVLNAIKKIKDISQKRNFTQTFDLIVILKGLDLKKTEQQVDFFTSLHFLVKKKSICGLVGPELSEQAKKVFGETILVDDFPKYQKDKKLTKKLADTHDFFVAQATIMPKVAQTFGRVFGPRGKMPNPKAGCVVPPNANLQQVNDRLQLMTNLKAKTHLMIQTVVGKEDQAENEVAENISSIYDQIIHHLPQEKNNVKHAYLKLTMTKPVQIGEDEPEEAAPKKSKKEKSKKSKKAPEEPKETKTKESPKEEPKETETKESPKEEPKEAKESKEKAPKAEVQETPKEEKPETKAQEGAGKE
jgi:large subunit ribosomal protein L1